MVKLVVLVLLWGVFGDLFYDVFYLFFYCLCGCLCDCVVYFYVVL